MELNFLTSQNKIINRFRFKITTFFILKYALAFLTIWGFFWGTGILVLRAVTEISLLSMLWGLLIGMLLATGLAGVFAVRQVPAHTTIRALLDKQNRCGGLFMAAEDVDLGEWQKRMPPINLPRLRWYGNQLWVLFTISALFVTMSFLTPWRLTAIKSSLPLEIDTEIVKLAEQIEILQEEEIIESTKAESLEEKLKQLGAEATGEDPVKTWEALDHLQDTLAKTVQEAVEEALGTTERLTQAETLAEGLMKGAEEMDPKLMTEAMQELSRRIQEATRGDPLLAINQPLSEQILKAIEAGSLTPEQLIEISQALRQIKGKISDRLVKLREAGLVDLKTLKMNDQVGQSDSSGLVAFLEQNAETMSVSEMINLWVQGLPGKGGITRGQGDAAMIWGDSTSEEGAKFKEQILPPTAIEALKDNQLVGVGIGAPSVETASSSSRSGALNEAATGDGSAFTQTILPRHRGTVKRYFERN